MNIEEKQKIILDFMTNEVMDKMIKSTLEVYNSKSILMAYDYFGFNCGCNDFQKIFLDNLDKDTLDVYNSWYKESDWEIYDDFMGDIGIKIADYIEDKVNEKFKGEYLW